jgi:hypothetical protein
VVTRTRTFECPTLAKRRHSRSVNGHRTLAPRCRWWEPYTASGAEMGHPQMRVPHYAYPLVPTGSLGTFGPRCSPPAARLGSQL